MTGSTGHLRRPREQSSDGLKSARQAVPPFESFAWLLTIARRVADDNHRRRVATPAPAEPSRDARPAYAELGELADGLPRKERAAVVLRYGYDLSYAAIGAALGSSEDAARQAASAGVRRLRRRMQ